MKSSLLDRVLSMKVSIGRSPLTSVQGWAGKCQRDSQTDSSTRYLTENLNVLITFLYGQPEHKMKLSESPWRIQQFPYSPSSSSSPEVPAKLSENKRQRKNRESYLREVYCHMGIPWLNIRTTWDLYKIQILRLHPKAIKSGFGMNGTQTSGLFWKLPRLFQSLSDQALSQLLVF